MKRMFDMSSYSRRIFVDFTLSTFPEVEPARGRTLEDGGSRPPGRVAMRLLLRSISAVSSVLSVRTTCREFVSQRGIAQEGK